MLARMLEAQAAAGVTHALVSDSFFMESAAEALPSWSPLDRARLYNDTLAALIAALHERFTRIPAEPARLSVWVDELAAALDSA
ncbi:MAG TPA: hypothetical protein VHC93_25590 [Methylomirabilota bacterium]|nr:hypothetical protein [Methylomirabilota bacterium]